MPKGVYKHKRSIAVDRFKKKISILENGCWNWNASKIKNGYGEFWNGEIKMLAHRWSYEYYVGVIPDGLEIDHLCRNRACVNFKHLEPVTRSENGKRGLTGFHRREEAKLITHCPKGHEYNEVNTSLRLNKYGGGALGIARNV